ncbi:RING finger protein [Moesziomyces antarcticus]|uniref:RBR-type E3 ubiquitin transferase n=2 Tax=Pseudozyma antarctica TaxID=84753 RepID=A0A081CDB6_PSEA2|nr:RING finger protein [Moesziomyces antarcticus]GAK64662.1 RING finger protein [Moesziomyces antarcticus]SPO45645.1 probable Ariadne-1 protein [Moesziomyces antarcticus]
MSDLSDDYLLDDDVEDTMDEDSVYGDYDQGVDDSEEERDDDLGFGVAEDAFAGGDTAAERSKSYQVEYKSHTIGSIEQAQQKEVEHVASMFMIKDTDAAILLRHFGWNKERLIERFMDSPDKVNLEAGVHDDPARPKLQKLPDFTCEICYMSSDDSPDGQMETLALACGHRYCRDCYQHYLEQKIRAEGESRRVQCMREKCNLVIDERTVGLVVVPEVFERYKILLNRTYVDDSNVLRWCPAPNCELAVECHVSNKMLNKVVPSVRCDCGHAFCFGCGNAAHAPAICPIAKLWLKKCEDDSETANWISANTKECPKCNSTIEKNGGCNHMTCRKCKYEWCWICAGPWSEHGNSWYNCNRFDEKSGAEARDSQAKSRAQLERYLHYFNRFANHEQSAKLDRDLYGRTEKKMEEMQLTTDLTWIEVQFLKKAVDELCECRMTLKWTYCMAYYLARNNMTELFEDNQRDLEKAVEDLSEQLEKPIEPKTIPELRQKVTDLTVYVHKRRGILLSDTAEGFQEDRWSWNVTF